MASTHRSGIEYMEPHVEWIDSENVHVLVSGFKREELRVQVTSYGKLKISGERVVDGGRVSRFEKEILIPNDCDVTGITAKYESEILQIRLPKSTSASVADPKHSHEPRPQLPDKRARETQLPEKSSHDTQPKPHLPGDKISHESQLPEKRSHEALPQPLPQLPSDKSSYEQNFQDARTDQLPAKHHPEDKAVAVAAKHNVARRVREAEATESERSRQDRIFDGVRAGRFGMDTETRKTKVTIVLAVVGALVVGYFGGRLEQAVRDGWTIVQSRS